MSLPLIPTAASVFLLALAIYKLLIFPLFVHPLHHIPSAHWSVPIFGDCWILYHRFRGRNNAITYAAHLKHGEVVRLGYNELSVNCVDNGIKTIYGGGWEKHAWYPQLFASYGVVNMFSTIHHAPHSQKKRTMANVYSKSYIASSEQVATNSKRLLTTRFLPLIQSLSDSSTPVDVHSLNNAFTMDFMSAFQFGLAGGTNFTQDINTRRHILHEYHSRRPFEFYSAETPWLKPLLRKFGITKHIIPAAIDSANDLLQDWGMKMCIAADSYLEHPTPFEGDEPIVYKHYKTGLTNNRAKDPTFGQEPSHLTLPTTKHQLHLPCTSTTTAEIYSEMLDHLGAGHETSAIALTYLYYELSKSPSLQSALHTELHTLTPPILWPPTTTLSSLSLPTPKTIDTLPLLNAILLETLRLHAPIPGLEPRVSPTGTHTLGPYTSIPSSIRVSSMPYTLHRNASVFPSPLTFDPYGWLPTHPLSSTTPTHLKEMHRWFWAFGSGGRMCIGSHLAIQEIKLIVAAIYSNWRTEVVEGGDEGVEEVDAYTTRPGSNELWLRFLKV